MVVDVVVMAGPPSGRWLLYTQTVLPGSVFAAREAIRTRMDRDGSTRKSWSRRCSRRWPRRRRTAAVQERQAGGLFPGRTGAAGDAAAQALRDGLLEVVRTETKGKTTIEWVRLTPRGVDFLHDHESPAAALHELRDTLRLNQQAVPVWLAEMRAGLHALDERLAADAQKWQQRLDALTRRVEDTLRRLEEAAPLLPRGTGGRLPLGHRRAQLPRPPQERRGAGRLSAAGTVRGPAAGASAPVDHGAFTKGCAAARPAGAAAATGRRRRGFAAAGICAVRRGDGAVLRGAVT